MRFLTVCCVLMGMVLSSQGCRTLPSRSIHLANRYESKELQSRGESQIQRGEPRPVIDALGWVLGIPSKILLWDLRADNHRISPQTEAAMQQYLQQNRLNSVRVRLNQYRPGEDWSRLAKNKSVGAPWRYSIGALSVLGETLFPGRLIGGDHYNPYTHTIHLYSDIPAVALHEGGHAKDFTRRKWKGTYAATYVLPLIPLYHESVASRDVVAYLEQHGTLEQQAEALQILYPAYGTYVGSAAGTFLPKHANPLYYGSVLAGHAVGRYQARLLRQGTGASSYSKPQGTETLEFDSDHPDIQLASPTTFPPKPALSGLKR